MNTKIIAFSGRKQSGKTICSEFLKGLLLSNGYSDVEIYNFADPLKEDICMNMFGLSYVQCYGEDHNKNELVDAYWEDKQLTARDLMQLIGTDLFRKLNNNVWVNALINKIKKSKLQVVIVSDCRFPNEIEAIKNNGGIVFRLNRNPHKSEHISESILDACRYDWNNFNAIINNEHMTVREQYDKLKKLM
ncbi:MAG: hypothetical protein EBQ89_03110, partial [Alphaproteobacteria bacterium]|nr:hypothetical protein [Alphaproteobacteria bacterium]